MGRRDQITAARQPGKALEYEPASGASGDDRVIRIGGCPRQPLDVFPPYCCACLTETDTTWTSAQGMSVPMCARCTRRWLCIRAGVIVATTLGAAAMAVMLVFEKSHDRFTANWWVSIVASFVGAAVILPLMLVQVVELFAPARCWGGRDGGPLHLRFRNRDYHRMTRRWMAGGRTEAMAPQGFPIPPARLKDEAERRVR